MRKLDKETAKSWLTRLGGYGFDYGYDEDEDAERLLQAVNDWLEELDECSCECTYCVNVHQR